MGWLGRRSFVFAVSRSEFRGRAFSVVCDEEEVPGFRRFLEVY